MTCKAPQPVPKGAVKPPPPPAPPPIKDINITVKIEK